MASAKFKESSEDREQSFNGKTDGENVGLINEPLLMDLVKRCLDNIYSGKSHGKEKCSVCREGTLKGCSKCKTRYCSIHCQMTDFQSHKVKCQKSKMNTFGSSCPDSQTNEGMNHGEGAAKENYINSKKIGINNERVNNNTQMDTRKNWTAQPNCMNKEKSGNQKSTEECNVKESKDEDKRKRRLKKGESYEVEYIDCVRKDHTYIVFPTELREEFDNLHKILEEKHTKFSPVDEIVVGKTYAVNFKNKWFRGKAIRSGNKTSVRLIDRGFFCSPKTESFRELPNELRCTLPMTAMIVFRKPYAKFTKCNIKVVSYEKNGVCVVEACEDSEEVEKMPNVPNLERRKENLNHFGSTSTISSNEKPPEDFDKSVENVSSGSLPFRSCSFTDLKEGQTAQFHLMKSEIDGNGNTLYGCLIPQPEEVDVLVTRKTSLTSKPFKQIRGQVRDFVVVHVPCSGGISPFCGIVTSIDNDKYTVFLVDGGYYATFENVYEVPEEECYNTKDLACKLTVKNFRLNIKPSENIEIFAECTKAGPTKFQCKISLGALQTNGEIERVNEWGISYIPMESGCNVFMTELNENGSVYVQLASDKWQSFFMKFLVKMRSKIPKETKETFCVGDYVLAKKEQWYRGLIAGIVGKNVKVLFVDVGTTWTLQQNAIRKMPDEFRNMPFFAREVRCALQNWNESNAKYYRTLIDDKRVLTMTYEEDFNSVKFSEPDSETKKTLNEKESTENQSRSGFQLFKEITEVSLLKPSCLPVGTYSSFVVLHIDVDEFVETGIFWATDANSESFKYAIKLNIDIHNNWDPEYHPEIGDFCIAKFEGVWYRATVVDNSEEFVTVHYIDFGNKELVKLEDIRKCNDGSFRAQPGAAVKCVPFGSGLMPLGQLLSVYSDIQKKLNKKISANVVEVVDEVRHVRFQDL